MMEKSAKFLLPMLMVDLLFELAARSDVMGGGSGPPLSGWPRGLTMSILQLARQWKY